MNLRAEILLLPISILLAIATASCGGNGERLDQPKEISAISDTIRCGNMDEAVRMTEAIKGSALQSADSMRWSEAMAQQGVNAYYMRQPELSLASSDSAIRWLESRKPGRERARILAKAYQIMGSYYVEYYHNPDSAEKYHRKAVEQAEASGIKLTLPQNYSNFANSFRMGAKLDSAAIYYHRAIAIADSLGIPPANYTPLYNGIAAVFTDMHDYDNGEFWWNKSMERYGSMDFYDRFATLTGLGNLYYYKQDYPKAEATLTRLREMLDSVGGAEWEREFNNVNLADVYIRMGRTAAARPLLEGASSYFSENQPNPVVSSYIRTLQIRGATKSGHSAEALLLAASSPEEDTLRLEQHLARLKALEELYDWTGNYRAAYRARQRHDALEDSLRSFRLSQQISTLNAIYRRDHRILNLEAENNRKTASIYKMTALFAILAAAIIGFILFMRVRSAKARKREDRMMAKIISLREENLRNRVTPHFIYNALNHELYREQHGEATHLDALVGLIRRQQYVASELFIPFEEELRFVDDYVEVISDSGGADVEYTCEIAPGIDTHFLFPSMGLQILVENAFKHGFPTLEPGTQRRLAIKVKLAGPDELEVSVFNNSGSSEAQAKPGGTGLRALLETIKLASERYRKRITLHSHPAAGPDGQQGYLATITLPSDINKWTPRK